MNDKLPIDMVQSFTQDIGKTVVFIIEAENPFPNPPFIGSTEKTIRNNKRLFSKMLNGTLSVSSDYLRLDNSAELHKPKFDLGFEQEFDFILTITLLNGEWFMNYFDKKTKQSIDIPFNGFMYNN